MGNPRHTWNELMSSPNAVSFSQADLKAVSAFMMKPSVIHLEIEMGLKWLGVGAKEVADLMKHGKYVFSSKPCFLAWLIIKRTRNDGGWFKRSTAYYEMWACELDGRAFQHLGARDDLTDALNDNVMLCKTPDKGGTFEYEQAQSA